MSYYYQKCCACKTVFTNKVEIDTCPICRGKKFIRKLDIPKKKTPKIKIESIRVEAKTDECSDTSYLGEYTDKASDWCIDRASGEFCCKIWQRERIINALHDRIFEITENETDIVIEAYKKRIEKRIEKISNSGATETGKMYREHSFFLPTNHVPHNPKNWSHVQGKERDKVVKEFGSIKNADLAYAKQDYERMEALNNGQWCYIGIIAKAKILVPSNVPESAQLQTITSGGLWGIESDSGEDFLKETVQEELSDLKSQLIALGVGKRSIEYAIKQWDGELTYK